MLDTGCLSSRAQVEPIDGKPLFVKLFLDKDVGLENPVIRKAVMGANNLLSAEKVASRFMGELQQCLQQCQEQAHDGGSSELAQIKERIKLRKHGPAVQMDVYHLSPGTRKKQYSVDMVPTIQISGRDEYYVPKPIKDAPGGQIAWRRSFSLKEKQRLVTIDKLNNGCRKQVLRVLKVIRNKESGLAPLTSYHLKTVLFRKSDELSNWKIDCLGRRLMDVIGQIEKELDRGIMPHYFLPGVNLLDGMGWMTIDNMRQRLKHLYSSEREMRKVIFVDSNVICGGGIYEESAAGESFRVYTNQASSDTSTLCINVCILLLGPIVACIVGILLMYITTAYILAAWRLSVEVAIAAARPSQLS